MFAPFAVLDEHVFISYHHLHLAFVHEIPMILGESFTVLVVHELSECFPVRKHESTDRVVV